jgi:uncharacterized Rossmann fold enzyme
MQGLPFVRNGKTLLSGIDPVGRAERSANAVTVKDRTLYFCPSPLYGYGLACFLSRLETEAPDSAALCVEADGELYELTEKNIDPSLAANRKLRITNICDAGSLCAFVREAWGARAFRRIEILRLSGGWQLFPEVYDFLCESLRREIAVDWSNALTLAKMGRLYIRNVLRNLSLVSQFPSAGILSFGEAPVLVLGAGPSLDETLDALEIRRAKILACPEALPFKIICVDTCLGALKERNIIPDLVIILESQHWNIKDFLSCNGWSVKAVVDLSSLPASTNILSGEKFLFFTPWTKLKIFERLKDAGLLPVVIPPLGSVGLTAVELARRLTTGKIICSGLDFSFTGDKYHARSTPGHRALLNSQNRLRRIFNPAAYNQYSIAAVSKAGLSVYTNPAMKNYRDLFEQEFGGDSRIFDIQGSGLPLGIKTLSLEEAAGLLVNLTAKNTINQKHCENSINIFSGQAKIITQRHKDTKEEKREECKKDELISFFENEKKRLEDLRSLLTGEAAADNERLVVLIDECDYLWAHFPDFAGGRRPELSDISFLKRLRTEIDPMLKIFREWGVGSRDYCPQA